jgi:hypothetical protein
MLDAEAPKGTEWPRRSGESPLRQIMKNRGNEAEKYLKTKEVTILNAADFARFERIFTQIRAQKEQKQASLRKPNRRLRVGNSDRRSAT